MVKIIIILLSIYSYAGDGLLCESSLSPGRIYSVKREVLHTKPIHESIFQFYDLRGNFLGVTSVRVWANDFTMSIDHLMVVNKRQGWSYEFLNHVLSYFPKITTIESMLLYDNYEATKKREYLTFETSIDLDDGSIERFLTDRSLTEDECKEAVKNSPAYKIRARFGFTEVVDCRDFFGGIELIVRKPGVL
jgi:hypothetical protein